MEVDKLNHEYIEGKGTPIIFIHGWLGSKEGWKKVRHNLDLENPMLFYDQRCHGSSACKEFDFNDLADDVQSLIDYYGIEKPVLVGHSMGGMVALTYFVRHTVGQNDVSGLFLSGTCASTPEPVQGSPKYYLDHFGKIDRREWAREITENYVGKEKTESGEQAYQTMLESDEEPIIYGLQSMVEYDVRNEIRRIKEKPPAIVVAGKKDRAIQDHMTKELAEKLECKRVELDATHLITSGKPEKFADLLKDFVKSL